MPITYEIIHDPGREARGIQCLTFTVNGEPSLKWFHPCTIEGLSRTYYVERCINALKAGLSREAFGGPVATIRSADGPARQVNLNPGGRGKVFHEDAEAAETTTRSGKTVRRGGRRYRYSLGGQPSEESYPTEAAAKEACAVAAFMTRGKLGRLVEVESAFKSEYDQACVASMDSGSVIATAEDGTRYAVRLAAGEVPRFKVIQSEE